MGVYFVEGIWLLFSGLKGGSEVFEDGGHFVGDLGVGRVGDGILEEATGEEGVGEERGFTFVLGFGGGGEWFTDVVVGGIVGLGAWVWCRAGGGRRWCWSE